MPRRTLNRSTAIVRGLSSICQTSIRNLAANLRHEGTCRQGIIAKIYAYSLSGKIRVTGREFDLLDTVDQENTSPDGIWANDETMWVSDSNAERVFAYKLVDDPSTTDNEYGERDQTKEFDAPRFTGGPSYLIWSDGTTMWLDYHSLQVLGYSLSGKSRDSSRDFLRHADNDDSVGIWSDGTTMFAVDKAGLYAKFRKSIKTG